MCSLGFATQAAATPEPSGAGTARDASPVTPAPAPNPRLERRLVLSADVVMRQGPGAHAVEWGFSHGMLDFDNGAALRVHSTAVRAPGAGFSWMFPLFMSVNAEPWSGIVSPWAGVALGGYLVTGRGEVEPTRRVRWVWGARARLGVRLRVGRPLGIELDARPFIEASAVEPGNVATARVLRDGWGFGIQLEYCVASPDISFVRQVTHGTGAPEGW